VDPLHDLRAAVGDASNALRPGDGPAGTAPTVAQQAAE